MEGLGFGVWGCGFSVLGLGLGASGHCPFAWSDFELLQTQTGVTQQTGGGLGEVVY